MPIYWIKRLVLPDINTVNFPSNIGQNFKNHVTGFMAWRDYPVYIWFLVEHKADILPAARFDMADANSEDNLKSIICVPLIPIFQ